MFRPLISRLSLLTMAGSVALSLASSAETYLLVEDFGLDQQNPMDDPSTTTVAPWTYSGPGGANSSRLFNPGGVGSGTTTPGWISIIDGSTITATIPLSGLAGDATAESGGDLFDSNVYELTFFHAAETGTVGNNTNFQVDVSSSGAITFISGGNGDESQSFTSLTGTGNNSGGILGVTPERTWTMTFSGSGLTTADTVTVALQRTTGGTGNPYTIFDDVEFVVNPPVVVAPAVATDPVGDVTTWSAVIGGEVTDEGNEPPTVTIYFGETDGETDPGMWDTPISLGSQSGSFSTIRTGLDPGTTYYYRAYAENSAGGSWGTMTESFTTTTATGISSNLASTSFAYQYEMDVNPSTQDLDAAGSPNDWFPGTSGGVTIPQTYAGGIAFSDLMTTELESLAISMVGDDAKLDWTLSSDSDVDVYAGDDLEAGLILLDTVLSGTTTYTDADAANNFDKQFYRVQPTSAGGTPEVLFRTDTTGSIQRQSLTGSYTVEVAVKLIGPKDSGDVGVFAIALDSGAPPFSFRMNIDLAEVNLDADGNSPVVTTTNDDAFHIFRVAYSHNDDLYWVWRDGVLLYGTDLANGFTGTNGGFNPLGSFFIGNFSSNLGGNWEVDYIRLHDDAVAP